VAFAGGRALGDDELSCTICQRLIEPGQGFVSRVDGRLEHARCPEAARKFVAGAALRPTPKPFCSICAKPIRCAQRIRIDGANLHVQCFVERRRSMAGGADSGDLPGPCSTLSATR
jgi:hypothetical protein